MNLSPLKIKTILSVQRYELSEYYIYQHLAKMNGEKNRKILNQLAADSLKHYQHWEKITGQRVSEDKLKVWLYVNLTKLLGLTFGIKMLEKTEIAADEFYEKVQDDNRDLTWIIEEEKNHEQAVVSLIDEDFLKYMGSVVLGSNDALVELTGTLAGLTLALQNNQLIGATGLITGIAAAFSMASSEYLSIKSEAKEKSPLRAAIYTGITYILTVIFLIFPYFISQHYLLSLGLTLFNATLIIWCFSFYIAVVQDLSFKKRFLENITLSFSIAFLSFMVGFLVREILHIEI